MQEKYFLTITLTLLTVAGCKEHKPRPSCMEAVAVTDRNGQKVRQTINGMYVKAQEIGGMGCQDVDSVNNQNRQTLINRIYFKKYWIDGRLVNPEDIKLNDYENSNTPLIEFRSAFEEHRRIGSEVPEWWFTPALAHKLYPIYLLPQFGLKNPDPNAGDGPVLSKPTAYWAVRGTQNENSKVPAVTFCDIKPPPDWDNKDYSDEATKARDPKWLLQGETYTNQYFGNTCRGNLFNEKYTFYTQIDVPGAALAQIDEIYRAVEENLNKMIVE